MEFNHLLMRVHCRMLINIFWDLSFCCPIIQTILLKISYQSILSSSNSRFRRPWEIVSCFNITTPVTPTCFTIANFDDTQKHRFVSNSCIPISSDILTNIVDIADSNQLPPRKPFGFTLTSNLGLLPPGLATQCATPIYTNIIFRTKLSSRKSANKLDSFLERQLHHDCSQVQLLFFVPQYISLIYLYIRAGTLPEAVF